MGKVNSKGYLCDLIKNDNAEQAVKVLENHPEYLREPLNDAKDTPGLILASTYGSNNIIKLFLDKNCDPNICKLNDRTTALMVAIKRNNFSTCLLLLERGADPDFKNELGLTAFDYSVMFCNYEISLYFKQKYFSKLKDINHYLEMATEVGAPLFNINLYIESLNSNVPIEKIPQFKLTNQQLKDFNNKLPDPNESWHQFFNRVMKFEIYQPPLVHKDSIPLEKRNSLYMRMQTKLLEIEFDKTIPIKDEEKNKDKIENDIENQTEINKNDKDSNGKAQIQLQSIQIKLENDDKNKQVEAKNGTDSKEKQNEKTNSFDLVDVVEDV